ncbi:hypothetical protein LIER_40138 [Lithospermum erythrorhizon]|uniref:Phytocyanin domain-containing protein n=1 Tax=Lithospermum erythrorhizon TaxID=34254 RepID=A0AAV3QU86_LITER
MSCELKRSLTSNNIAVLYAVFEYSADKDSVLYVKKDDYDNCNIDSPLEKYTDDHTVFQFNHSGPNYFISGVKENCQKNQKVHIVVLADRSGKGNVSSPPPAPSGEVPPSPAPVEQESPPPPPQGSVDINPTPAPSQESSPPSPSGASLIDMNVVGSIGAFIGSVILLVS